VLDILHSTRLPSVSVGDAVAQALIKQGFSKQAYRQFSLSDEFLIRSLRNKRLGASETQALVSRRLSSAAKEAFLQRKDKRVGVNTVFLRHNLLTRDEVSAFMSSSKTTSFETVLTSQPQAFTYQEFVELLQTKKVSSRTCIGFLNYDEFEMQDFFSLLKDFCLEPSNSEGHRYALIVGFLEAAESLAAKHSCFVDEFAKFLLNFILVDPHFDTLKCDFLESYFATFVSASFTSEIHAQEHLSRVEHLIPQEPFYREGLSRTLRNVVLNPRVSNIQAFALLEFLEGNLHSSYDTDALKNLYKVRAQVETLGFDVWHGSFQDLPKQLHKGLHELLIARMSTSAASVVPTLEALQAPFFSNQEKKHFVAEFKDISNVTAPFVENLLSVNVSQNIYDRFHLLRHHFRSSAASVKSVKWLQVACQKFGADPASWETFVTLFKTSNGPFSEEKYLSLVYAAEKINRV